METGGFAKMKALVVEDDLTSRTLLQKFLDIFGTIDVAENGLEAMNAYQLALEEGEPYDLICLDIIMPEMDGREVLARIRELEDKRKAIGLDQVKIIMTTTVKDKKSILDAFKSGAEAYLCKPIMKDELIAELRALNLISEDS